MNLLEKHLLEHVVASVGHDLRFKFFSSLEKLFPQISVGNENLAFVYLLKNKQISLDHLNTNHQAIKYGQPGLTQNTIAGLTTITSYFSLCLLQARAFKFLWKGKLEKLVARTVGGEATVQKLLGLKEWRVHFTKSNEVYALHTAGDGFIIARNGIDAFFWDFDKNCFKVPKTIDNPHANG